MAKVTATLTQFIFFVLPFLGLVSICKAQNQKLVELPLYGPIHEQACTHTDYEFEDKQGLSVQFERLGGIITFCITNPDYNKPAFMSYKITVPYGLCELLVNNQQVELDEGTHESWFPLSRNSSTNLIQIRGLIKNTRMNIKNLNGICVETPSQETNFLQPLPAFSNSGFEDGNLNGWEATGEAFNSQPTYKDNAGFRNEPTGAFPVGDYWIGTFENRNTVWSQPGSIQGNEKTGILISESFIITHQYLSGLVGGGIHPDTSVVILIDGIEQARYTGNNHETMRPFVLDMSDYAGQKCQIKIIDENQNEWGHINTDNFIVFGKEIAPTTSSKK